MNEEEEERQRAVARAVAGDLVAAPSEMVPPNLPPVQQPTDERISTTHIPGPPLEERTTPTAIDAHSIQPGPARPNDPRSGATFTRNAQGVYVYNGQPLPRDPRSWQAALRQMGVPGALDEANRIIDLSVGDAPPPEPPARGRRPDHAGRVQRSVTATNHAPVTPETLARQQLAGFEEREATRQAQANEVNKARIVAEGAAREAHLQHEGAVAEDREVAMREQQISERMAAYDDTIQRVQENRIDPEAFFGGDFNRRLGAGILVALGQFASGLGGGENAALGIINRSIDRNIRAQEANQANLRAGAGLEGQALGQFRALLGDEQAAREASRAAHLAAASAQVGSMLARARPEELQGLQRLQAALQESQAAAQQAAADRARWTSEETSTVDLRTGVSQATRAALGITRRDLSPEEQQAQRELADRTRAQEATLRSGGAGARRVRARSTRARARLRRLPPSAENPFNYTTEEDLEAARESNRDRAETRESSASFDWERLGLVVAEGGGERVSRLLQSSEERQRVVNAVVQAQNINRVYDRIFELRRNRGLWEAMTDHDRNGELEELHGELVNARRINYGFASLSNASELDRIQEAVADPTRSAFRDLITFSGSTDARLRAARRRFNQNMESELGVYGLEYRSRDNQLHPGRSIGDAPVEAEESPTPVADEGVSAEAGGTLGAWSGAIAGSGLGPLGMLGGAFLGGVTGAYNAGRDEQD